jgi:hypothetical protein
MHVTDIKSAARVSIIMDELVRHIANISGMDWQTLAIILLFCVATAFALKEYVAPVLAILALPVLFLASVLAQYLFLVAQMYIPNKLDQWLIWTVLAVICGNTIGIAVVAAIGRLRDRAVPLPSRPRTAHRR